jgi:hypothetical protein
MPHRRAMRRENPREWLGAMRALDRGRAATQGMARWVPAIAL